MKAKQLKANQAALKSDYERNPETAIQTLVASGTVNFDDLAFDLETPSVVTPAGLHESSGGDGSFGCSVEIMLASWAGCAGVTLAAVAHSMKLIIRSCRIEAAGTMDFKGTLAVDRDSPVGLTEMALKFSFETDEPEEKIAKLIALTERYCVVHQTLAKMPQLEVKTEF